MEPLQKTNDEWKKELPADVYAVTREGGTEAPNTGKYYHHDEKGVYHCSNCGLELFTSTAKFDSGSGWPSFDDPVQNEHVIVVADDSHGMQRTEVRCARCAAHLGHVFEDGPVATTGKRYCINSLSLDFKKNT
jgi:peptide-methionine (R)-S-oxide reductase